MGLGGGGEPKAPRNPDLKDTKSPILAISRHLFPSLIFVFSTVPGKREYFEILVHKKCTRLTPEELTAIALMSLVTLKKNPMRGPAILLSEKKNSAIFYSLSALFNFGMRHLPHLPQCSYGHGSEDTYY